jgi:hypothetical protein
MDDPTILEIAVQAMLEEIEGSNGVYADEAPQDVRAPYLIHSREGTDRDFCLQGPTGLADARIEIDAYSPSKLEALKLSGRVRQALNGFRGTVSDVEILACRLDTDSDVFVDGTDPKLFGVPSFYLISYREV